MYIHMYIYMLHPEITLHPPPLSPMQPRRRRRPSTRTTCTILGKYIYVQMYTYIWFT